MANAIFPSSDQISEEQKDTVSQQTSEINEVPLSELDSVGNADPFVEDLAEQETDLFLDRLRSTMTGIELAGGDPDDDAYQASVVGEEAVGGQTPTPDQNVTEELQKAAGITVGHY